MRRWVDRMTHLTLPAQARVPSLSPHYVGGEGLRLGGGFLFRNLRSGFCGQGRVGHSEAVSWMGTETRTRQTSKRLWGEGNDAI